MGLKQKAVGGLFWTFIQQFSSKIITFVVSIILARLLSPAEFGLIGMLSIFIGVGISLMDSGMTSSIIRTKDADQKDYSTVFVLNIAASVVIYVLVYLAAPYIASFYGHPVLKNILRVYAISFFLSAFMGVQSAKLTKDMNFKAQMLIQIPSVIGSGILGVSLAYYGFGVWSLVYMSLCQTFLLSVQYWFHSDWRPSLRFYSENFKHHFSFGYKITLHGLIGTIYQNIFTVIIGKFYSADQLGFYSRALSMRQFPISNLSAALEKVTYPMFSSINDDNTKLKQVYRRLIQQVVFWIIPLLTLLIVVAEPLFRFLLTEKWVPAVPYFQILCVSGMLLPLQSYNGNIIKVKGHTGVILKIQIIEKIFALIGIVIAIPFGIHALLYSQIFSALLSYNMVAYYGGRMIAYPISEQLVDILPSVSLAMLIGFLIWLLDSFILKGYYLNDVSRVVINGVLYFGMYLGISSVLKLAAVGDFKNLVFNK